MIAAVRRLRAAWSIPGSMYRHRRALDSLAKLRSLR